MAKKFQKFHEVTKFLGERFEFRTNELTGQLEVKPTEEQAWKDINVPSLWYMINMILETEGAEELSIEFLENLIKTREFAPLYNPFKDWLEQLEPPKPVFEDPFERLSTVLVLKNNGHAERERLKLALTNWFVSAIRCLYDGIAPKHCLVLIGAPGIGKTPFLKNFLPRPLREFLLDVSPNNQEEVISEAIVLFIEEMEGWIVKNRDEYTSLLSAAKTGIRSKRRLASFLGTANDGKFLKAAKENTERFVCFELEMIWNRQAIQNAVNLNKKVNEHIYAEGISMTEVWAAALELYKGGYRADYTPKQLLAIRKANALAAEV